METQSKTPTFKQTLLYILGLKKELHQAPSGHGDRVQAIPKEDDLDKNGIPDWLEKDHIDTHVIQDKDDQVDSESGYVDFPEWLDEEVATMFAEKEDDTTDIQMESENISVETVQQVVDDDEEIPDWLALEILDAFGGVNEGEQVTSSQGSEKRGNVETLHRGDALDEDQGRESGDEQSCIEMPKHGHTETLQPRTEQQESNKKSYNLKQVLHDYSQEGEPEESVYDELEQEHMRNVQMGKEWVKKRGEMQELNYDVGGDHVSESGSVQENTETGKHGNIETLKHGDIETGKHGNLPDQDHGGVLGDEQGDIEMGKRENTETLKHGNTEIFKHGNAEPAQEKITLGMDIEGSPISLDLATRLRHTYIVGMTGMGKTTMLESNILQDIEAGRGVGLLDPHGDLYERVLQQIPKNRINDVVLFDAADVQYPVGFNILENNQNQLPSLITSSMIGVFKKLYGHSWGPRMEYILRNASLTLLERKDSTLLTLARMLSDGGYRNSIVSKIDNAYLKRFWEEEFGTLTPTRQAEIVSPILNKVGQFLSIPLIRNIIAQPKSSFSPRWIMDNNKIFLANLSKGFIGEDVSEMLGSLLVSKFYLDAASRSDIKSADRTLFFLYVDEFQNFATDGFAHILSESRKYGLALTLAHQYIGQLDTGLQEAIFGNTATMVAFKTGYADAKKLAPVYGDDVTSTMISNLPKYQFLTHTNTDDRQEVVSGFLQQPPIIDVSAGSKKKEKIQRVTREKFAKKREFVEEKLEN